jgi:hypothetical protein
MAKKKLTKEDKARRSLAMKAAWARKRERGGKNIKRTYKKQSTPINTIPVDPNSPSMAEWKSPDPIEVQLKDAHATIHKLRGQLNKYYAFKEVINSLKGSMAGMISIVNSTNVILDND